MSTAPRRATFPRSPSARAAIRRTPAVFRAALSGAEYAVSISPAFNSVNWHDEVLGGERSFNTFTGSANANWRLPAAFSATFLGSWQYTWEKLLPGDQLFSVGGLDNRARLSDQCRSWRQRLLFQRRIPSRHVGNREGSGSVRLYRQRIGVLDVPENDAARLRRRRGVVVAGAGLYLRRQCCVPRAGGRRRPADPAVLRTSHVLDHCCCCKCGQPAGVGARPNKERRMNSHRRFRRATWSAAIVLALSFMTVGHVLAQSKRDAAPAPAPSAPAGAPNITSTSAAQGRRLPVRQVRHG